MSTALNALDWLSWSFDLRETDHVFFLHQNLKPEEKKKKLKLVENEDGSSTGLAP